MSTVDWDAYEKDLRDAGDGCSDCGCPLDEHRVGGCTYCDLCDGYQ